MLNANLQSMGKIIYGRHRICLDSPSVFLRHLFITAAAMLVSSLPRTVNATLVNPGSPIRRLEKS